MGYSPLLLYQSKINASFDNLGGVPVFNLPNLISNSAMFSDRFTDAGSPARPAVKDENPVNQPISKCLRSIQLLRKIIPAWVRSGYITPVKVQVFHRLLE